MTKKDIIERMQQFRPPFLDLFECVIRDVDPEAGSCEMDFTISTQFCHSGDIVQGGFVTAMLDAVSSHAVFGLNPAVIGVSTLELKVSYFAVSRSGKFRAVGQVEKLGRNFGFLSAELFDEAGIKTASLSATAKVTYQK
ncbi:MAG: PaaI family thioesterase [Saprospiraceae bacterium]|nr:PaaI family thioesterase [Saprospiraceae bacterium]